MSVLTEGSEEMFVQVTRIDEILTQNRNQPVVKISIPELDNVDVRVLEAICDQYKTEILENEMFIKYDGGNKEAIQFRLCNSAIAHKPNLWVTPNQMCSLAEHDARPDAGVWFVRPTYLQRQRQLLNPCPPADVWIEVINPDRANALRKLGWIQQKNLAIEYVGIAMPNSNSPYHQNPNLGIPSIPATPAIPNARPS
ncbi:5649_t:CDS:2 [Funneliformis caledonium]|uniref:5649_t:CDS:1 n=1 Tax=Funneliformis caledonium TaxID=1117310 RepID=A0A9N9HGN4_9GLOM|nr:5649_t:CDS:2 [Funneliformis caledonium]